MGREKSSSSGRGGLSRRTFVERAAIGAFAASALPLSGATVRGESIGAADSGLPSGPRPAAGRNRHYPSNREPLVPSAYVPLPLGSVRPAGWLRVQLTGWAAGMTGLLDEVWPDVGPNNGWLGGDGDVWERGPYWLDGMLPLAHLLEDPVLLAKADLWIEATLASAQPNGYFGPSGEVAQRKTRRAVAGEDWWPKMVMLKVLQSHYEATGDERVLELMTNYFRYQLRELPGRPLGEYTWWGKQRGGENLSSVHWLYNRTGDDFLLDLGVLLNEQTERWAGRETNDPGRWHVVNTAMGVKQPGVWYAQSGNIADLEAVDALIQWLTVTHGQPQGIWSGDEELHGTDPGQGVETCAVVEYMFSLEQLLAIAGDLRHAEILERVAYSALPAALSPVYGGRHYFQRPNQVACTLGPRSFTVRHQDDTLIGLETGYGCCTANLHQGWPKFVQHLWYATPDDGLAALVYGPCEVTAKVGDGAEVALTEETDYPFDETVRITMRGPSGTKFPVHLHIPSWAEGASIIVDGRKQPPPEPGSMARIDRTWADGDVVEIRLPMKVRSSRWHENSVALSLGPMLLALERAEQWSTVADRTVGPFEAYEIRTGEPWNFGIRQADLEDPDATFEIVRRPLPDQPWAVAGAPGGSAAGPPVEVRCTGRRVPEWMPYGPDAGPVPWSPIRNEERDEQIVLVPFGSTKIRISEFPVTI
ncbi:MAG: beta-L-arabinofuranosidase domain-containing protein [Gemmatimonadota bacterium]